MRMAPITTVGAKALLRPALRLCASSVLVTALFAQCTNPTQISNQTISSGSPTFSGTSLVADAVVINGSASVTFQASQCIELRPGFRATAGTAATTFRAMLGVAVPTISGILPSSGMAGTAVTISGTNFSTSGTVTFNGVTATTTSWTATSITATVPAGAMTGNVVVTAGGVSSSGVVFTVPAGPTISGLAPTSGAAGNVVTITGANFGSSQGTSTVTFNNTLAGVTSWTNTSIAAVVPTGATSGDVIVRVNSVASNSVPFTVSGAAPPSKEYIRLGARVIAIENYAPPQVLPAVSMTVSHSGSFGRGQQGTYTITVSNNSAAGPTSGDITVSDTLPAGMSLVSMSGTGWSCTGAICKRSDALTGGSSYPTLSVVVTVASNAASSLVNQASVSGGGMPSPVTVSDTTDIVATAAALTISKTHVGNFIQGQNGTYAVTVSNLAGALATSGSVTITETLPAGLTLMSIQGSGWSCTGNSCNRSDSLPPNSSYPAITVVVNVSAGSGTSLVNTVQVSGGGSATASATDTITVNANSCVIAPISSSVPPDGVLPPGVSFQVNCTGAYTVRDATTGTKWFTITTPTLDGNGVGYGNVSGKVTITAPANYSGSTRTGTLQINSYVIPISQAATLQLASISPATAYLYQGGQQQFDALFQGQTTPMNSLVTWTASSGTITNMGLFTMPSGVSSVTITATYGTQQRTAVVTASYFSPPSGILLQASGAGGGPTGAGYSGQFYFWESYQSSMQTPNWNIGFTPTGAASGANDCFLSVYGSFQGLVQLTLDSGYTTASGYARTCTSSGTLCNGGSQTTLAADNSRCAINLAQSDLWLGNGGLGYTILNTRLAMSFLPAAYGTERKIYASDGASMPWTQIGDWVVPPYQPPAVTLETPTAGQTVASNINVTGWGIDNAAHFEGAIAKAELYIDGVLKATQTTLTQRSDVCSAYPSYTPCPNSGFSFSWDTRTVANGSHEVRVDVTDSDTTPKTSSIKRNVQVSN